jgi:hypothetical protein
MRYRYGIFGAGGGSATRACHEKAYRRRDLAVWDARWHGLTPQARSYFLNNVKFPEKYQAARSAPAVVSPDTLPPGPLKELADAGLVEVRAVASGGAPDRAVARAELSDFMARVRMLNRRHLLDADRPNEVEKYVEQAFYTERLLGLISDVLRTAGIQDHVTLDVGLRRYVAS